MSTQQRRGLAAEGISEEAVVHYLQMHPDFFERHASLLATLRLPHQTGPAVSLVERQVSILRSRNTKLERKLQELLAVARSNDTIAARIHQLAKSLIAAPELSTAVRNVERCLREGFGAEFALLLLFEPAPKSLRADGFLRRIARNNEGLAAFASLLESAGPRCGRLTEAQRDFLFGSDGEVIASAALVPLGAPQRLGLLAIASRDADRFLPTMSVDFLTRIGDLVSHAIATRTTGALPQK